LTNMFPSDALTNGSIAKEIAESSSNVRILVFVFCIFFSSFIFIYGAYPYWSERIYYLCTQHHYKAKFCIQNSIS